MFPFVVQTLDVMLKRRSRLLIIIQTFVSHTPYTNILLSCNVQTHLRQNSFAKSYQDQFVVKEFQSFEIDNMSESIRIRIQELHNLFIINATFL